MNKLKRTLFWRNPLSSSAVSVVVSYTVLKSIHGSHQIYLVETLDGVFYFRICEETNASLASVCRSRGAELMGQLLGMGAMYPKSILAELPGLGRGLLQEQAPGLCIMKFSPELRRRKLTPSFQREINDLNLLDAVCRETDHTSNNYNVILDESGQLVGLSAFDNNGVGAFTCSRNIRFSTYAKVSPIVTEDGLINRPHLSSELCERLRRVTLPQLLRQLRDCMKPLPVFFLYSRILRLNRAVKKTAKQRPSFLLRADEWNSASLEEELSGQYGKTYLISAIEDG